MGKVKFEGNCNQQKPFGFQNFFIVLLNGAGLVLERKNDYFLLVNLKKQWNIVIVEKFKPFMKTFKALNMLRNKILGFK